MNTEPREPTCDDSCAHTIDVGYVHTLTDDGVCRADCPHPDHGTHYEGNSLVCSCGARLGTFSVVIDDPDDAAGRGER
jgi:hypothetical protein